MPGHYSIVTGMRRGRVKGRLMELPKPTPEHEWLHQFLGEWTCVMESNMGPDQPPMESKGVDSVRSLGGLWILCEGRGEMPDGSEAPMIFSLGYDTDKQRFVGTFITSCMTRLWVYDGGLDAARKVLTLDCEGPSFTDPTKMTKYQDSFEMVDADHRRLSSQYLGDDGQWHKFMTATYTRKK